MTWTEVINEDVAVVHVEGLKVLIPISDDVGEYQLRHIRDQLVAEQVLEDEHRRFVRDTRARRQARERLQAAGYDESEIPL